MPKGMQKQLCRFVFGHGAAQGRLWGHLFSFRSAALKTCFPIDQQSAPQKTKVAQVQTRGRHDAKDAWVLGSWVPWPRASKISWYKVQGSEGRMDSSKRPVSQKEILRDLTRLWARGPANLYHLYHLYHRRANLLT